MVARQVAAACAMDRRAGEATTADKAISGTVPRVPYNSGLDHHVPLYPIVCIASWADPARPLSHRQCPESVQTPLSTSDTPGTRTGRLSPLQHDPSHFAGNPILATSNLQIAARWTGLCKSSCAAPRSIPPPLPHVSTSLRAPAAASGPHAAPHCSGIRRASQPSPDVIKCLRSLPT